MPQPLTTQTRERITAMSTPDDRLAVLGGGAELYWLPIAGDAQPALWSSPRHATVDFRRIEQLTGPGTMRTHNLLTHMAAKYLRP